MAETDHRTMSPWATALAVTLASALMRLLLAARIPLFPDETYYWEWSRHLAAGYFDHPPLIAFFIRGGTLLLGDSPLGVRLFPVLGGTVAVVVILLIARDLGGARSAAWSALVAASLPVVALGLVLATPDAPLVLFLALTLLAVERAVAADAGTARSRGWWLLAGLFSGMAFLAKYPAVLVPAAVLAALGMRPALRTRLRRWEPYAAAFVMLAVAAPVVWWNARHGWMSFRFQLGHGLGGAGTTGRLDALRGVAARELALLGGAAVVASPLMLVPGIRAVRRALRRDAAPQAVLLAVLTVSWCAVFVFSATRHAVEANWLAPAFLGAVPLLGAAVVLPDERSQSRRRWVIAASVVGLALNAGAYALALHPLGLIPAPRDPLARAAGWDALASKVAAVTDSVTESAASSGARTWIAANTYQDASELAFNDARRHGVFALNVLSRPNQYDLWPTLGDVARPGDALVLLLHDDAGGRRVRDVVSGRFATVADGGEADLRRATTGGDVISRRRIWIFTDYRGPTAMR